MQTVLCFLGCAVLTLPQYAKIQSGGRNARGGQQKRRLVLERNPTYFTRTASLNVIFIQVEISSAMVEAVFTFDAQKSTLL
jgi:hypothetical protein